MIKGAMDIGFLYNLKNRIDFSSSFLKNIDLGCEFWYMH